MERQPNPCSECPMRSTLSLIASVAQSGVITESLVDLAEGSLSCHGPVDTGETRVKGVIFPKSVPVIVCGLQTSNQET